MKWKVNIGITTFIFDSFEEVGVFVETALKHFTPCEYCEEIAVNVKPIQEGGTECSKD